MKRILKVKFGSDKKHVFVYEDIKDKDNEIIDEFDFKSKDRALPEFYTALQGLTEHACRICEFPREYDKNVTVIGVSFSYTEVKDTGAIIMGATITFRKELEGSNSPLIVNTPHKPSEFYDGKGEESPQDPKLLLSIECVKALEVLQEEAIRYIDGERDQLTIFSEQSAMNNKKPEAKAGNTPIDADEYQGDAFKKVQDKPKKKTLTKAAKEFRQSMQNTADKDNVNIKISSGNNVVEFKPNNYNQPGG